MPKRRNFKSPAGLIKSAICKFFRPIELLPAQFEEDQRDQLTIQRLYSIILDSVHVTEAEVRDRYRIDQEKINLNYIKLPISDLTAQVKLTEDDIKKYYERNKESLKEPLKIQLEYLQLSLRAIHLVAVR